MARVAFTRTNLRAAACAGFAIVLGSITATAAQTNFPNRPVRIGADTLLVVRNGLVGLLDRKAGRFAPLPTDEHIVFNDTLYIPPFGTQNRKIEGELGQFALDLGDGYLLHGTSDPRSIGKAVTHGCIRLGDMDLNWLYVYVPTGTPVYIY